MIQRIIWSSVYTDRNVLSQLVPIVEDHYEVHMELDAELVVDECCAAENLWEQHVHRYFKVRDDISICYLDVLNLSCRCLTFERFYTYKLNFYRLNLDLGRLANEIPIKWFIVATVDGGNLSAKVEFRHFWFSWSNLIWCNREILRYLSSAIRGINSLTWHFTIEFSATFDCRLWRSLLLHVHRYFIHNWEINANIRIWQECRTWRLKLEWELQWFGTWEYLSTICDLNSFTHKHDSFCWVKGWTTQFSSDCWNCIHECFC